MCTDSGIPMGPVNSRLRQSYRHNRMKRQCVRSRGANSEASYTLAEEVKVCFPKARLRTMIARNIGSNRYPFVGWSNGTDTSILIKENFVDTSLPFTVYKGIMLPMISSKRTPSVTELSNDVRDPKSDWHHHVAMCRNSHRPVDLPVRPRDLIRYGRIGHYKSRYR